ncbi:putative Tetratricopeptide repeat-containing protein [Desulfosarcina cetonica]|uniref:tetratricopeptide repeat protein n=1 Tax=Desulfosarcina cetonica TaxID=90730 RepID=UPI00155D8C42|nr:tetratricopeptide repeat protein [Desulfosarcina cetonica]VTR65136.1 putative Tetratricopeptide repeat-containing protein [Desulfosarcina cetonica]
MRIRFTFCLLVLTALLCWIETPVDTCAAAVLTIDADTQYGYAQSRFDDGAFDEAIAEFNRFIHFFPDDPRTADARHKIGLADFAAGRYAAAAKTFTEATAHYSGTALQDESFFLLSRCHARQGMPEQAIIDLHNLLALKPKPEVADRANYELGWLHVDQGRWRQAETRFNQISPDGRQRLHISDLMARLEQRETIPRKDPTTAGLMSIVPGGGQLYCGRVEDAAIAFLLNTGLIWAAWEAFDNDQPALGGVISFVGFGFYAGNIYGAINDAHKFNRDRSLEFREGLYSYRHPILSLAPTHGGVQLSLSIDF